MGLPGAGKTTAANALVAQGYERLNRDETGGTLAALTPLLAQRLDEGARSARARQHLPHSLLARRRDHDRAFARAHSPRDVAGHEPRECAGECRLAHRPQSTGRLLTPEELRASRDPAALAPSAQFRSQREFEPPIVDEGFSQIERVPFARTPNMTLDRRAVILWSDGVLRRSRSGAPRPRNADDIEPIVSRREVLSGYARGGWLLLAMSLGPEVADRPPAPSVWKRRSRDYAFHVRSFDIEYHFCPHPAGPPVCWCRKPLPGLGVLMIHRHGFDPSQCIFTWAHRPRTSRSPTGV